MVVCWFCSPPPSRPLTPWLLLLNNLNHQHQLEGVGVCLGPLLCEKLQGFCVWHQQGGRRISHGRYKARKSQLKFTQKKLRFISHPNTIRVSKFCIWAGNLKLWCGLWQMCFNFWWTSCESGRIFPSFSFSSSPLPLFAPLDVTVAVVVVAVTAVASVPAPAVEFSEPMRAGWSLSMERSMPGLSLAHDQSTNSAMHRCVTCQRWEATVASVAVVVRDPHVHHHHHHHCHYGCCCCCYSEPCDPRWCSMQVLVFESWWQSTYCQC